MKFGFVYVLCHPDMPDLYKIGFTTGSPYLRMRELSRATGLPRPFEMVCYAEYEDAPRREAYIHRKLDKYRINDRREFFRAPMRVIAPLVLDEEMALATVDGEAPVHIWDEEHAGCPVTGRF